MSFGGRGRERVLRWVRISWELTKICMSFFVPIATDFYVSRGEGIGHTCEQRNSVAMSCFPIHILLLFFFFFFLLLLFLLFLLILLILLILLFLLFLLLYCYSPSVGSNNRGERPRMRMIAARTIIATPQSSCLTVSLLVDYELFFVASSLLASCLATFRYGILMHQSRRRCRFPPAANIGGNAHFDASSMCPGF